MNFYQVNKTRFINLDLVADIYLHEEGDQYVLNSSGVTVENLSLDEGRALMFFLHKIKTNKDGQ